ncbi:hypothetical protein [Kutzneria buriramensis]|uniref:Uncharacterized protein n=1 Tax=Kutzneria buriramensis TaxID=1045776 RepID=A0A3E0I9W2_9PSEU|nr:hypothetical protein [Kutzneria buriramensis]REH55419.1 hypothetical protein BCF44_101439 [Kutzneria buriramensis]
MNWGTVELEPEVLDWLKNLTAGQFATATFRTPDEDDGSETDG